MAKSTAVAKKEEVKQQDVAVRTPEMEAWLAERKGMGVDGVDERRSTLPRISLMHPLSENVSNGLTTAGQYWHRLLQEELGSELSVVPIFVEDGYILWDPTPGVNKPLARGVRRADGIWVWDPANTKFEVKVKVGKKIEDEVWDTGRTIKSSGLMTYVEGEGSKGKEVISVLFAIPSVAPDCFGVMSFQKTAYNTGRKFRDTLLARKSKGPSFQWKYKLGSTTETNKDGQKYLVPTLIPDGMSEFEMWPAYEEMYLRAKEVGLSSVPFELEDEPASDASGKSQLPNGDSNY